MHRRCFWRSAESRRVESARFQPGRLDEIRVELCREGELFQRRESERWQLAGFFHLRTSNQNLSGRFGNQPFTCPSPNLVYLFPEVARHQQRALQPTAPKTPGFLLSENPENRQTTAGPRSGACHFRTGKTLSRKK